MSQVKFINKDNLRIARENMGLDTLAASSAITTTEKDLVQAWESGDALPTWSQVAKLSKLYNVSELLFFADKKIPKYKSVPDYRVGVDKESDDQVRKLVNLVITRQGWLEKRLREGGAAQNTIQGSGKRIDDPKGLADYISKKLEISLEDIKGISGTYSRKKTLEYLIKKAESKGIFVGKTISYHRLEVEDLRGVFISNDYCPFIVLNRRDSLSAQIFSFIHELAHLFRKTDAISNSLSFRSTDKAVDPEEVFCNKVAANLLLPASEFTKEFYDKRGIEEISRLYKVSEIFIFYRLKDMGKIRRDMQGELERVIKAEMENNLRVKKEEKNGSTGGSHINNMKDSNGSLFNRIVYNSFLENRIGYTEASNLLRYSPEKV